VPLNEFNRIVFVSGSYDFLSDAQIDELKNWIKAGGILITVNSASRWAIDRNISSEKLVVKEENSTTRTAGRQPTSIFSTKIDLSSPIAFGLTSDKLPVIKENSLYISSSRNSIAKFNDSPLLNGYI